MVDVNMAALTKTIVITGASDGIGESAARQLTAMGHKVVVVGRSPVKTEKVAKDIGAPFHVADYAKLADVVRLAGELSAYPRIDVLINNAGAAMDKRKLTVDGFEQTFQVNVLAPFLLTYLLKDKLCDCGATLVQTASIAANIFAGRFDVNDLQSEKNFSPLGAYGNAKLCGFLLTKQWHMRCGASGLCAVAFQPGIPRTNFGCESTKFLNFAYHSPLKYLFTISRKRSAKRMVYFATAEPDTDFECGGFYSYRHKFKLKFRDKDNSIGDSLWKQCVAVVEAFSL